MIKFLGYHYPSELVSELNSLGITRDKIISIVYNSACDWYCCYYEE